MKIALYISTFNRANYVSKMAKSLSLANDFDKIDIKIFDDASNEFEIEFLQNILPSAKIHRNAENILIFFAKIMMSLWQRIQI